MSPTVADIRAEIEEAVSSTDALMADGGTMRAAAEAAAGPMESPDGLYASMESPDGLYAPSRGRRSSGPGIPVSRPTTGPPRATFYTPVESQPGAEEAAAMQSRIASYLDLAPPLQTVSGGIHFGEPEDPDNGSRGHPHMLLDIAENVAQDVLGGMEKSTLVAAGSVSDQSMQPCFVMGSRLPRRALEELEKLYRLVTGIDSTWYYNEQRLYVDTGQVTLAHANLDVAEILTRREAMARGIGISKHSFKVLPEQSSK